MMQISMEKIVKNEVYLRVCATVLLVLTACLVRLNTQTKVVFTSVSKTATYKDLNALVVVVFIDAAGAAYNLLQIGRRLILSAGSNTDSLPQQNISTYRLMVAWACFLLDQAFVYIVFAGNSVGLTASAMAVSGAPNFQWMKVCDRYTRFCFQIGGAVLCGYTASLFMVILSSASAFSLFRLHSPERFLVLKGR